MESLSVWHGHWLDQLAINCTDGYEPDLLPPLASGGGGDLGVCAGSGGAVGGVESIEWYQGSAQGVLAEGTPVVHLNVFCLDGDDFTFADE